MLTPFIQETMETVDDLKTLLSQKTIPEVIHRYLLARDPICFQNNPDAVYELQKALSDHFGVHTKNIEIVGSAKLGISLNPKKERYGKKYDDESDIDLVVVSSELFDKAWHGLMKLDGMRHTLNEREIGLLDECNNLTHRGYISPDKLPIRMDFSKNWWSVFETLSNQDKYEKRKIRGRLFKDWWFVERYYSIMLAKLSATGV